ncbi:MAG: AI-2E family transporter [Rickettsiales bacterium]|jgi:predicted PurR-regulated permease PerM|nr:AI-2E family transporter [Rickettsiales bacterium]
MKSTNVLLFLALIYVLHVGKAIFLPFVMALFLWVLIWLLESSFKGLVARTKAPAALGLIARPLSILFIGGIAWAVMAVIVSNLAEASHSFAKYQPNLESIVARFNAWAGTSFNIDKILGEVDLKKLANSVLAEGAGLIRGIVMVIIYLAFLLLEEKSMYKKLPLVFKGKKAFDKAMVEKILSKIRTYLFIKTGSGILTAVLAYAVMKHVGLDFALFWAMLMFAFNYMPTIGSAVASIPPIVLAVLQFDGQIAPIAIVAGGITAIQVGLGNFLEPRILGASVGISPLALIFSLVIWGWIWGFAGMFLCVPIMIIALIVLYNIPSTKKVAILLSQDGENI